MFWEALLFVTILNVSVNRSIKDDKSVPALALCFLTLLKHCNGCFWKGLDSKLCSLEQTHHLIQTLRTSLLHHGSTRLDSDMF